jgi:hypothetical protein
MSNLSHSLPRSAPALGVSLIAVQIIIWPADRAAAHEVFHIFTPVINKGHWGVELNNGFQSGFPYHADKPGHADVRAASELGLQAGVTDYWMMKVALEFEREVGGNNEVAALVSENVFRLDKWAPRSFDVAWFTSLAAAISTEATNAVELGPVVSFSAGPITLAVNPFFEKTFGQNREEGIAFVYAYRATYSFNDLLSIGIEGYGEVEDIGNAPQTSEQMHRMGPVLYFGTMHGLQNDLHNQEGHGSGFDSLHGPDYVDWHAEIGVLFGLTETTLDTALKLNAGVDF